MEHRVKGVRLTAQGAGLREHCELRIAKPGTRPKGGSPKDNFEFGNTENAALRQAQDKKSESADAPQSRATAIMVIRAAGIAYLLVMQLCKNLERHYY
jgi:hypothetical protein